MHLQWRPIDLLGGRSYSHTQGQSPKTSRLLHHRYMRAILHLAVCMSKLYLSFLTIIALLVCIKAFKMCFLVNTHVVNHRQQHNHISFSSSSPSHFEGDYVNNGFLMVSSNGGLNQMRAGVSEHLISDFA